MIGHRLLLVTSRDCHLCDYGRGVLSRLGVNAREIDADSTEAAALATAGLPLTFLPVLWDGIRVLGYGRLSEKRLRKELGL